MHRFARKVGALFAAMALALTTLLGTTPALAATGSFTIQSTNAEFAGKTVTAYQMFKAENPIVGDDGNVTSATYTLNAEWEGFFQAKLNVTDTGAALSEKAYNYVKGLSDGNKGATLVTFAKDAADYAKTAANKVTVAGTATASATANAAGKYAATFTGLEYGYYVFAPQGGSTSATRGNDAMLYNLVAASPAPVELKSEYPGVSKTVENNGNQDNHSSAQVGDAVKFTLNSAVPDTSEYTDYKFVINDVLSEGLDYNKDASITVGGQTYTGVTPSYDSAARKLTIDFSGVVKGLNPGDAIVVTYSATLNEKAVAGEDKASNKAYVEYSNNPGTTDTGTSVPSITHTYDFKFDLKKVDENNAALAGAEFSLTGPDGNVVSLVADGDSYRPAKAGETGATTVTTPGTGVIKFTGLKEGTYKLTEVNAPAGYNKLAAPVEVKIAATYNEDGTLDTYTVTYGDNDTAAGTGNVVTVQNKKGTLLPSTGGMGTVAFTVVGVAVVVAGIVWMALRKRARNS